MEKINLKEMSAEDLLATMGMHIETKSDHYFYLPFWFAKLSDGQYEVLSFQKLPNGLKKHLEDIRSI